MSKSAATLNDARNTLGAGPECPPIDVLVVDDNLFDQERFRRVVRTMGFLIRMEAAGNLDEFRAALNLRRYDIVVLDYNLSGATGFDALDELKRHATNAAVPVIMLATEAPTGLVVEAMRKGCSSYMPKDGLSPSNLGEAIRTALEDRLYGSKAPTKSAIHSAANGVLRRVAHWVEGELRPIAGRMSNEVHQLSRKIEGAPENRAMSLAKLEREIMAITNFLAMLERQAETRTKTLH